MPVKDEKAFATRNRGRMKTSGRQRVTYRTKLGQTREALVLGDGSEKGLKLSVIEGSTVRRIVDNVEKAAGPYQTNVYISR